MNVKKAAINFVIGVGLSIATVMVLETVENWWEGHRLKKQKRDELQEYKEKKLAEIRERRRQMGIYN